MTAADIAPKIGVVGAGAMGQGIAQIAIQNGCRAVMLDAAPGAAEAGRNAVLQRIDRLAEKGKVDRADAEAARGLLDIAADYAGFADCDLVIEAVVERLDVKQAVFKALEQVVQPQAILATNTSSLSIGSIAGACQHPGRVAGMHFFNPVPLMRLVEIVRGSATTDDTVAKLMALGTKLGRTPIEVKDTPGFLVNLGGRALNTEALAIVQENVASCAEIDAIMRDCGGFRMGPFELMDLTGMDVNFPVTEIVWNGYFNDPRLRSTPFHANLFRSGRLGRKTGSGYYTYTNGQPDNQTEADSDNGAQPQAVIVAEHDPLLRTLCETAGVTMLDRDDGRAPLLIAPWGEDCTEAAHRLGLDHRRLVAIDPSGKTDKRITMMTAPGADPAIRNAVAALCRKAGSTVSVIADSPGFVNQRICAMVMNLGCEIAQMNLATPDAIDTAFRFGLNYPLGPLAMAVAWGLERVYRIMTELQRITGDDRYRPSPWLRRRARLGLSALTSA
jgi:3-hydroxybutyryl-CoA dehydrogenase